MDRCGQIIAYTPNSHKGQWSVHYANEVKISSFKSTDNDPYRLEATYAGDIVFVQSKCTDVKLMDYNGSNVRVLNPPPQVTEWDL